MALITSILFKFSETKSRSCTFYGQDGEEVGRLANSRGLLLARSKEQNRNSEKYLNKNQDGAGKKLITMLNFLKDTKLKDLEENYYLNQMQN